ncbi:MAG TPA: hypothetical protein VK066_07255 [Chloroflexota bacterium]|nr:hypothetical protein [Chloroflexota bacterium]
MADMLYVGTEEGLVTLCSADGTSWHVEHQGLREWAVPAVAVLPSAPNCVLAGTRGDGVWMSDDCGATWRKPSYGKRGPGKVRGLAYDPRNGRLYAGCEPIDLYVSDNLGQSWERLDSVWDVPDIDAVDYPLKSVEPHVRHVVVDPQDPQTLYIALQVGYMLKSTDGGATWRRLDRAVDADVHTIVVDPVDPRTIVIATGGHDYRAGRAPGRALYRSTDAGETWSPVGLEFEHEYAVPLVMHPRDHRVLCSAVAKGQPGRPWQRPTGAESLIIRSTDGGDTWQPLDVGSTEATKGFPEALAFAADESDRLFAGYRGGDLLSSPDGGTSWTKLDAHLPHINDMKCVRV